MGGLVSQGLGTSMLQMGNIIKNPRIWIAPTLARAITGPLATCLFHFEMNGAAVSSGMGTCGLVGQIGVYTGWVSDIAAGTKAAITPMDWAAMVLLCFVLPAVLSVVFCEIGAQAGLDQGRRLEAELNSYSMSHRSIRGCSGGFVCRGRDFPSHGCAVPAPSGMGLGMAAQFPAKPQSLPLPLKPSPLGGRL